MRIHDQGKKWDGSVPEAVAHAREGERPPEVVELSAERSPTSTHDNSAVAARRVIWLCRHSPIIARGLLPGGGSRISLPARWLRCDIYCSRHHTAWKNGCGRRKPHITKGFRLPLRQLLGRAATTPTAAAPGYVHALK